MEFKGQDILSTKQFDKESMERLFSRAQEMEKILDGQRGGAATGAGAGAEGEKGFERLFDGKILASLFFEPSTRTRFSFETGFLRLGGQVVSGADMMTTSSVRKKETLSDTGRVVSRYADLIVMRHPEAGSAAILAEGSTIPVINAGDGANQHPTQALLDVYTMWKAWKGSFDGKVVVMVGDLKNGRVPHSQCDLLKFWKVKFIFVAPLGLRMPEEITGGLRDAGFEVQEVENLGAAVPEADAVCATRIQEERFASEKEAMKYRGVYVINRAIMGLMKTDALLMHPLPRVDEISVEVDDDSRARYFEQVSNGLALRMALMAEVLGRQFVPDGLRVT